MSPYRETVDRAKHLVASYNSGAYRDSEAIENLAELMQLVEELLPSLSTEQVEQVYVVFDGPPAHEAGRFVETHTEDDRGCGFAPNLGPDDQHPHWEQMGDYWRLGPFLATGRVTGPVA